MSKEMSTTNSNPFTASQWQELEHQALIFKYMVSRLPIPPDLILTVKKSMDSSSLLSHQPLGWRCFQLMGGYGRKVDPEPGRCRRTDGKKWRCSKEAYPDSKYCERHMHRGRNRSRKPVENATTSSSAIFNSSSSFSVLSLNTQDSTFKPTSPSSHHNSLLYPSPFAPPSSTKPLPNNTTHQLFPDSRSYPLSDKAHRYLLQMREGEHGAAFLPEASGTRAISLLHDSNTAKTLTTPSSDDYSSQLSLQSLFHRPKFEEQTKQEEEKEQHCFVLGSEFKSAASSKSIKVGIGGEETKMKPFHHFLGNCPPPESRDYPPWQVHDIEEEKQQTKNASFVPATHLSVSMPLTTQDLF